MKAIPDKSPPCWADKFWTPETGSVKQKEDAAEDVTILALGLFRRLEEEYIKWIPHWTVWLQDPPTPLSHPSYSPGVLPPGCQLNMTLHLLEMVVLISLCSHSIIITNHHLGRDGTDSDQLFLCFSSDCEIKQQQVTQLVLAASSRLKLRPEPGTKDDISWMKTWKWNGGEQSTFQSKDNKMKICSGKETL